MPGNARAREVSTHLKRLSRDPFRDLLTRWLVNGPTAEQIAAQAAKYPDRWAQGAAILGRLAGFTERTEVEHSGEVHHVHHLSDAELDARIAAMDRAKATVIEHPAQETLRALVDGGHTDRRIGDTDSSGEA